MTTARASHGPGGERLDVVQADARAALAEARGGLQLVDWQQLSVDGAVWRASVLAPTSGAATSVVVKGRHTWPGDPRSQLDTVGRERRGLGWAGTRCPDLVPRVLAAGPEVVVMEDHPGVPTLNDLLMGRDPAVAEAGLIAYARAIARLATATAGQRMPGAEPLYPGAADVRASWDDITAVCGRLGISPLPGSSVHDDVDAVRRALIEPGPWLAFSAGDPCPTNVLVDGPRVVLVDLEASGEGHCLLEAATLRFPFVWCTPWACLPEELLARAEAAYRRDVAAAIPAAADDRSYQSGLAMAMAALMVIRLRRLLLIDNATDDLVRRRTQIIRTMEATQLTCEKAGVMAHLSRWSAEVAAALRQRWPEGRMVPVLYPAFR